jgi:hypothetical protein
MDPFLDDFITYENQYGYKTQGLLDQDFPLSSPFSEHSDSTGVFPAFMPKTIQNLLDPDESQFPQAQFYSKGSPQQASSPFYTAKSGKNDYTEPSEATDSVDQYEFFNNSEDAEEPESKLNNRSKRIQKREKAKERVKTKTTKSSNTKASAKQKEELSTEDLLQQVDARFIPEGFNDPDLDDKTRKKMIQMIRNRVSAQNSRDRKKVYLQQLEETNNQLTEETVRLEKEKVVLMNKLKEAELTCQKFREENETLKRKNLCIKCGCTLDIQSPNSSSSEENSPILRRSHAGGNFFGLGMSFAFIFCILLVFNGDYFNGGGLTQGGQAPRATTMHALANIATKLETCVMPEGLQAAPLRTKELAQSLAEMQLQLGGAPILEKIKPHMDQFKRYHENVYRAYENNKAVVDLSEKMLENRAYSLSSFGSYDHHTGAFLEEEKPSIITTKNKTSTLFCPNGFEFFTQNTRVPMEEEKGESTLRFSNGIEDLSVGKTLDLEKADFVQLLVPKNMIGRYGINEISSETGIPIIPDVEDKTLIEVWAKIYAVRDLALSL